MPEQSLLANLSLIGLAASSFAIAFSGALVPGPLLVATVDLTMRHGAISGPLLVLGHGLTELVLVGLLFAGLAPLASNQALLAAVALTGALMLWWMAAGMLRADNLGEMGGSSLGGRLTNPVWAGVVLSLLNPYWSLWWATIGLGYVIASQRFGLPGLAAFFAAHVSADLLWYAAVSAAVARGKAVLSPRAFRALALSCAALLVLSGGFFAYTGVSYLL